MEININLGRNKKGVPLQDKELASYFNPSLLAGNLYAVNNTDNIPLSTYREMRLNPQISAALAVITFSIQRTDWYIESKDPKVKEMCEYALRLIWNRLIRSISKSFSFGFSPNVKVFSLDEKTGWVVISKIKDLKPELCKVKVDKFGNYDGFYYSAQGSFSSTIPSFESLIAPEYTFWYTDNMEDGNLYGESRLKHIYTSWYTSNKVHLFANRYYERFGDPLLLGRAPTGAKVKDSDGKTRDAQQVMVETLKELRNNSVAVLPAAKDESGNYLYDAKYIESQMRGQDFETYLRRLDMEMLRGLFVPGLIYGGESGGSFALGEEQKNTFLANVEGILANIKDYIDLYILPILVQMNMGDNAAEARWNYQPLDKLTETLLTQIVVEMIKTGKVTPEVEDISKRLGIQLKEVPKEDQPNQNPIVPGQDPNKPQPKQPAAEKPIKGDKTKQKIDKTQAQLITNKIMERLGSQIDKVCFANKVEDIEVMRIGFKGKYSDLFEQSMVESLQPKTSEQTLEVAAYARLACDNLFTSLEQEIHEAMTKEYPEPDKMKSAVSAILNRVLVE